MPERIAPDHPLRELFHTLVERAFYSELGLRNPGVCRYLADVLVEFTHRDHLFRVRDARGRRLEEVAEMLVEGDVALNATSFEREREVHKHIGDFTLFWTGVYPEMLRLLRSSLREDHLLDYVAQGRKSYQIASTFTYGEYAREAAVLRQLSEQFETCMHGLHLVRRDMEALEGAGGGGSPDLQRLRRLLES